jgi:hypothetical protein
MALERGHILDTSWSLTSTTTLATLRTPHTITSGTAIYQFNKHFLEHHFTLLWQEQLRTAHSVWSTMMKIATVSTGVPSSRIQALTEIESGSKKTWESRSRPSEGHCARARKSVHNGSGPAVFSSLGRVYLVTHFTLSLIYIVTRCSGRLKLGRLFTHDACY